MDGLSKLDVCQMMLERKGVSEVKAYLSDPKNHLPAGKFIQTISNTSWVTQHRELSFDAALALPSSSEQARARFLQVMASAGLFRSMPDRAMALLQQACHEGDVSLVGALYRTLDPSLRDADGNTPLHLVCRYGNADMLRPILTQIHSEQQSWWSWGKQLVGLGSDPLASCNARGCYPLQLAYSNPKIPDVERFMADVGMYGGNYIAYKQRSLLAAANLGDLYRVKELLQKGVKADAADSNGFTALMYAAWKGHKDVVEILLVAGAKIDAADNNGNTALMLAAREGHKDVVEILLSAGTKIDAADSNGFTALMQAARNGHKDVMEMLLSAGAKINAADNNGNTALMLAAREGHKDVVEMLLSAGANVAVVNKYGETALLLALIKPVFRGTALLEEMREKDGGLTGWVLASKELAHRYGIDIELTADHHRFKSTGWNEPLAVQALHLVVSRYYDGISREMEHFVPTATQADESSWAAIYHSLSPETQQRVNALGYEKLQLILNGTKEAIEDSCPDTAKVLYERLCEGKLIGVCTRDEDHCVTMAIVRAADGTYRMARCNKGKGSGDRPGILIDTARKVKIGKVYPKVDITFFQDQIEQEFECSPSYEQRWIKQKSQKVGNCTVANTNGMELALLVLQLEPLLGYDSAVELAQAIKKARCEDSRLGTLQAYLSMSDQLPFPLSSDLLLAIFCKENKNLEQGKEVKLAIAKWFAEHPEIPIDVHSEKVKEAFLLASSEGHKDMVQALLKAGANVDAANGSGETALMAAAMHGHKDIVETLLSAGVSVDVAAAFGLTALMLAAREGHKDVVEMLLAAGAKIDILVGSGTTVLIVAAAQGHKDVVETLLVAGAKKDVVSRSGNTALMLAIQNGRKDVVEMLLAAGANVAVVNKYGETALSLALMQPVFQGTDLLERMRKEANK